MAGGAENKEEGGEGQKWHGRCLNRLGARVMGVSAPFSDIGSRSNGPEQRGLDRWASGLCEREAWADRRERRNAARHDFEDRNVRRKYGQRCRYIFNGWAIKWTPNATKLGRRPVYTIIRPHAKLHPIPRTFLCHL